MHRQRLSAFSLLVDRASYSLFCVHGLTLLIRNSTKTSSITLWTQTNALVRQKRSTRVLCSFKWLLCYAYVQSVSDISSTTWEIHITSLCRLVQMQQNWIQKICCLLTLFPSRLRVSSAMHLLPEHKFRFRSRCQSHLVQTTSSTESWAIVVKIV